MDLLIAIITGTVIAATPLVFAALGELVVEKSGVINLGIEGMMLVGVAVAAVCVVAGLPPVVAVAAAVLAGASAALLFAVLTLSLYANQYAAGLALAILGSGVSAFIGRDLGSSPLESLPPLSIPVLSDIPVLGELLFQYDALVYCSFILYGLISYWLFHTKGGLVLRTMGEAPELSQALGCPVLRTRYLAVVFGGGMSGLAGAYLAVAYTPLWVEDMTSGRGWIALALVIFATWRPGRVIFGAWLFGGMTILQLQGQASGLPIPTQLLSALPYLTTIAVLVYISRDRRSLTLNFPKSLGKTFRGEG